MEISEEVDNDNSFTTRKDITLIDAIFKDDSNLASPSKNFRIKNSFMKPLFLLTNNPSPINHAQILANSKNCEKNELIQPQNFKKNVCTSPKNISISPKSFHCQMKKPKFPDIIEPGNFSYLLMETDLNKTNVSSKLQYHNSNTPKSRNSKINSEKEEKEKFSPSKIERSYIIKKKIAGVSPPSKKSSETKKMENIKLDKETLRDLNRFTDKNFIKSIKASFRKLEIIEKINEDNFKNEKSNTFTEKTIVKRNLSTNISISDRNLLCETSKLPLISPDYSPRKRNLTFKNSKIPKI